MKTIAVITARGGSKGVPGKNIRLICGKPLISYTIEIALSALLINEVIVSSDSDEILGIAAQYPRVIIHHRSKELASDESPVTDTIRNILCERYLDFDMVMLLQPTSPLRISHQLDEAILKFSESKFKSLVSVCEMEDIHPARMYWKNIDNSIRSVMPEFESNRRQDIPPAYYRNGSIYLCNIQSFLETNNLMAKPSLAYIMPSNQLLNIDSERDMLISEVLIKKFFFDN